MDDNSKGKSYKWLIIIIIIAFIWIFGQLNKSQYEKDSKSWMNKTYDEMTDGEKDAMMDYLEWKYDD